MVVHDTLGVFFTVTKLLIIVSGICLNLLVLPYLAFKFAAGKSIIFAYFSKISHFPGRLTKYCLPNARKCFYP